MNIDKQYMEMYKKVENKFSDADQKEIDYSFYRRASSYYYRLNNKIELKKSTKEMLKRYPFKYETIKALIKTILVKFKKG